MPTTKIGTGSFTLNCDTGQKAATAHTRARGDLAQRVSTYQENEELEGTPYMANLLEEIKHLRARLQSQAIEVQRHVAHCTAGCTRTSDGLSNDAFSNDRSPVHSKPTLPPIAEIASRVRAGEALVVIAAEYDRHPSTIVSRLTKAGYSSRTGIAARARGPVREAPEPTPPWWQPWREDALCAQTDPEGFFPEKGGSTRHAKSICDRCTVAAECLDYALANQERFGIWGGLSERERRPLTTVPTLQENAS
jgi:WhiB family redox-sensing transcriptional regulator